MEGKKFTMSTGKIVALVAVALVAIIVIMAISGYNSLVNSEENVNSQFANIETQLQRRLDLIPNLVNTVQGYIAHEEQVINDVVDARAKLAGATTVEDISSANSELDSAISRLLVVVENYPDLKADTQFTQLQDELAGTENRISTARIDYNDAVSEHNRKTRTFPNSLFAGMFGFEQAEYFEAAEGSETAPTVDFGV